MLKQLISGHQYYVLQYPQTRSRSCGFHLIIPPYSTLSLSTLPTVLVALSISILSELFQSPMAMMSNEGEKKCPLCAEEMDWTDQQLKPCNCGYEVCVWCWHHIMDMAEKDETEGRCPACRATYDKEKVVGKCERLVAKNAQEIKPQKPRPKKQEEKKDLTNVRVIQRKMAYIIGLPLSLADEDILQRRDYFGQYGKVCKISLSKTSGGAIQQFINDSCSVYITYSKEEEAIRCIQSVHGFLLEGRALRASFGTAKYCHAWLKNSVCNNSACLYLHTIGADEGSFGKDEEAAVNTRNRVHQIVGATHNMQQRSGTLLPPPLDGPLNTATDRLNSLTMKKELTSNGNLACSLSSKDQNWYIKTPSRSFLDVVAQPSSGLEFVNVIEEKDSPHFAENSYSESDKDLQQHEAKSPVSDISDNTKEQSSLTSDSSLGNLEDDFPNPSRNLNSYANEISALIKNVGSLSDNGFTETKTHPDEEIVGQLRRLNGHNITSNGDCSALDAVESNIVSSILSLDFDSCDSNSLSLPHNLAERFGGSDSSHGSIWNSAKSDQSKFSFAKEASYTEEATNVSKIDQGSKKYSLFSDYVGNYPMQRESLFSSGPQTNGLRPQISAPPGFSVAPRDAPPGFVSLDRTNQRQPAFSRSYPVNTVSYMNNDCFAPSNGHIRSMSGIDYNDPTVMVVRGGQSTPQNTTHDDEARLWLLMQQAEAGTFTKQYNTQFSHSKELSHSTQFPSSQVNSWFTADQSQAYTPSPYNMQFSQQKYSNGHWSMQNDELGVPDFQRNDRLGLNKFFSGHRDLMYQMQSTGDVYNRVYGL